jgi:hypothetical protein
MRIDILARFFISAAGPLRRLPRKQGIFDEASRRDTKQGGYFMSDKAPSGSIRGDPPRLLQPFPLGESQ